MHLESTFLQQRGAKRRPVLISDGQNRSVVSESMVAARRVALRVNGMQVTMATLCRGEKGLELVITDPWLGDVDVDESFTVEGLELVHSHEIRSRLPNHGWRKVSLRMLIALLGSGVVRVVAYG